MIDTLVRLIMHDDHPRREVVDAVSGEVYGIVEPVVALGTFDAHGAGRIAHLHLVGFASEQEAALALRERANEIPG